MQYIVALGQVNKLLVSHHRACVLQPACAKFYLCNDVMINTLEPAKLSIRGIVKSTQWGAWNAIILWSKLEYWHGIAVLHRRTHQWQMFTMSTVPVD